MPASSNTQSAPAPSAPSLLTVYYDGSCPLCTAEIAHYRKQDSANQICFVDASQSDERLARDLTKTEALARFHVRLGDGKLVSGAAAFVGIWHLLPRWRVAARLAAVPGMTSLLEIGYRLFLPARPVLARVLSKFLDRL